MNGCGESGVSLIEVLAALVLLSFGLLGAAVMNAHALGELNAARSHNRATVLAGDLANRLRAHGPLLPAEMPAGELEDWLARVESELPGGSATLERTIAGGVAEYGILLRWDERRGRQRTHVLTVAVGDPSQ